MLVASTVADIGEAQRNEYAMNSLPLPSPETDEAGGETMNAFNALATSR